MPHRLALFSLLVASGCQGEVAPDTVAPVVDAPQEETPVKPEVDVRLVATRLDDAQVWSSMQDLFPWVDIAEIQAGVGAAPNGGEPDIFSVDVDARQAMFASAVAVSQWPALYDCSTKADEQYCARKLVVNTAAKAWRGPLDAEEDALLRAIIDEAWEAEGSFEAVRMAVEVILLAPRFRYLVTQGDPARITDTGTVPLTSHEVAARLALFLWDGLPDAALREAADKGELVDPAVVAAHATRMLADPRAERTVGRFHDTWLGTNALQDHWVDVGTFLPGLPDAEVSPESTWTFVELMATMRAEVGLFTSDIVLQGTGTFAELFTSSSTWTTDATRHWVYAGEADQIDHDDTRQAELGGTFGPRTFARTTLQSDRRAGVLTLPGVLAPRSSLKQPSPVQRGVFVLDRILCDPPEAPPAGVTQLIARPEDGLTNRNRLEEHVANPSCASCHASIDGIGFTFEHYNPIGAWRDQDAGQPVDASGAIKSDAITLDLTDAVELAAALSTLPQAMDCYVDTWTDFALGEGFVSSEADRQALRDRFALSGGLIPDLLVQISVSPAFLSHTQGTP